GAERIATPAQARAAEARMQRSSPHCSATFGAAVANTPKHNSGRTVSTLVMPAVRSRSARSAGVSGAGATRSDRWLRPTAMKPAAKTAGRSIGTAVLTEKIPQVRVEEDARRIEFPADALKVLVPRIQGFHAVTGQEMDLAPMGPGIEASQFLIELPQKRL